MAIPERFYSLSIGKYSASTGTGRVESAPSGISLSSLDSITTAAFPVGTLVTLAAIPDTGSIFAGWGGACNGTGACSVTMDQLWSVSATFTAVPVVQAAPTFLSFASLVTGNNSAPQTVTISNSGAVTLVVSGITIIGTDPGQFAVAPGNCPNLTPTITAGGSCTVSVTFSPTSVGDKNASLLIAGSDPVNPSLAITLTGTGFLPQYVLTVDRAGTGRGIVNSSPGIDMACAVGNCTRFYDQGTQVTMTASPDASSVFTGWGGACSGSGSCSVTMNDDKSVTATFIQGSANIGSISYSSIAATYASAAGGDTIKLYGSVLLESLDLNRPITVTLEGGYNTGFNSRNQTTFIQGLTISSGTVIIDGITIQ